MMYFKEKDEQNKLKGNEVILDKKVSNIIKGVAIFLMLIHHFWGCPDWVLESNRYSHVLMNSEKLEVILGGVGKICVAMFAFITGYAIYINSIQYKNFKYRVVKVTRFLLNYWVFAFGFIVVGYLMGERLPDKIHFIYNLFGLGTTVFKYGEGYVCVTMAWYVSFYFFIIICLPVILIHTHKGFIIDTFLMSIILNVIQFFLNKYLITNVYDIDSLLINISIYTKAVLIGYYVGEYKVFDIIYELVKKLNSLLKIFLAIIMCLAIFILRSITPAFYLEHIYVTFLIFTIIVIYKEFINYRITDCIGKVLFALGIESLNLWFLHSIFFTPERKLQFIAYWTKNSVFSILCTILIMLPICRIITKIQKFIWKKIYCMIHYDASII